MSQQLSHAVGVAGLLRYWIGRAALLLVGLLLLGAPCRGPARIRIEEPRDGVLIDDPVVWAAARVPGAFDPLSVETRLDGVDLIAALGLVPPFLGQGGSVSIGSDVVTVSEFDFETPPRATAMLSFQVTGLPAGDHDLEVEGVRRTNGSLQSDLAHFALLEAAFEQRLQALGASGRKRGAEATPGGGMVLANASLAEPFAAAPVGLSDGGELRAGFVAAAEGAP